MLIGLVICGWDWDTHLWTTATPCVKQQSTDRCRLVTSCSDPIVLRRVIHRPSPAGIETQAWTHSHGAHGCAQNVEMFISEQRISE